MGLWRSPKWPRSMREKNASHFLKSSILELQKRNIPQKKAENNRFFRKIMKIFVFILKICRIFFYNFQSKKNFKFYHIFETIVKNKKSWKLDVENWTQSKMADGLLTDVLLQPALVFLGLISRDKSFASAQKTKKRSEGKNIK